MSNCLSDIKNVCVQHVQKHKISKIMCIYDEDDLFLLTMTGCGLSTHLLVIGSELDSAEINLKNGKTIYVSNIGNTVEYAFNDKALNSKCDIIYLDITKNEIKNNSSLDFTIGSGTLIIIKHNDLDLPKFVKSYEYDCCSIIGDVENRSELYTIMIVK